MKRRNLDYFNKGKNISNFIFKGKFGYYFKCLIYLIASFIAKITLFLYPISKLADYRFVKELKENRKFNLYHLFDDVKPSLKLWNIFLLHVIKSLIIISGLSIIAGMTYLVGHTINLLDQASALGLDSITLIVGIPGGLVGLLFLVYVVVHFEFAIFYILSDDDMNLKESLFKSSKLLTDKEAMSTFMIVFMHIIALSLWGLLGGGIIYILFSGISVITSVIISAIIIFFLFKIFIKGILSIKMSVLVFFEDIVDNQPENLSSTNDNSNLEQERVLIKLFKQTANGEL